MWIARHGFRPLALLWLPAGVYAPPDQGPGQAAAVRFGPGTGATGDPHMWPSLPMAAGLLDPGVPCGLPLPAPDSDPGALGCRRLWRPGYRRGAWLAGIGLGAVTIAVSVVAGLPGPVAIGVCALVLSLPVWGAWWWLAWRG